MDRAPWNPFYVFSKFPFFRLLCFTVTFNFFCACFHISSQVLLETTRLCILGIRTRFLMTLLTFWAATSTFLIFLTHSCFPANLPETNFLWNNIPISLASSMIVEIIRPDRGTLSKHSTLGLHLVEICKSHWLNIPASKQANMKDQIWKI